jgi:poly(A) polymerase
MTAHIDAEQLGISLATKKEPELFKWFLACLLFGKPIQQEVAQRAYETLISAGVTSLDRLMASDWDDLVELLDQAHYVRYDFSTATKLLQIAREVKERYGSVVEMVEGADGPKGLENRLVDFKGIGPVTAAIFMRDAVPLWFKNDTSHDFGAAKWVADVLDRHGYRAYIIGGAVRDLYIGHEPKDFDLATNATPDDIMRLYEFQHSKYKDAAQAYGVTRVSFEFDRCLVELEVATFRRDMEAHRGRKATQVEYVDLEEDVMRRDFTINALALDTATDQIIDFVGGIDDIDAKIIRFIGDPATRIREDPLRIMRAVRFKNQLGMIYSRSTSLAIEKAVHAGVIEDIATDRMRDELTRLLLHPSRRNAVGDLYAFGILERTLPEVTAGKGVRQPHRFHAEGDVWQHEQLILDYLPHSPTKRLVWAALLHDIGKGPTRIAPKDSHDHARFDRHYAVGAEMAKTILRRLHFSTRDTNDICWMIYNHMAIDDLPEMRPNGQQRMMGHPAFEDLLELHRADAAASWRPGRHHSKPQFRAIERIWHDYQQKSVDKQQPSLKHDLGIDGTWLMKRFGARYTLSGPLIGKILQDLDEWYRDEGVRDKEAYEARVYRILDDQRSDQ